MKIVSYLCSLLVLLQLAVFGQIPNTLNYQGILADASGTAVADGQYELFFSLFDSETGGVPPWDELQTVTVENGVFSVELGTINAFNISFDQSWWLEIEYNGDVLTPRTKLTASPYSLNTADIPDSIVTGGKIADDQVVRSFNGQTDDVKLLAGANITLNYSPSANAFVIAAGDSIQGGGGNSPWLDFGAGIYYDVGNVGIGTSNPTEQLEIDGNLKLPATTLDTNNEPIGVIMSDTSRFLHSYGEDNFFAGANAGNFTTTSSFGKNTGVGKNALRDITSGQKNTAVGYDAGSETRNGTHNTALGAEALNSNTSGFRNVAIGHAALAANTTGSRNTAIGDATFFQFDNGTRNTAIGASANVSSGLTNATAIGAGAFAVASNSIELGNSLVTTINTSGTINAAAFVGDGSGLTGLPGSPWQESANGIYYNSGKIGIGLINPTANVHSFGSGATPSFYSAASSADFAVPDGQPLQFGHWDGSSVFSERLRITSDGDVGIGTGSPGVNAGASRYLTFAAAESSADSAVAALEIQGSVTNAGGNTLNDIARIDFNNITADGQSHNAARIALAAIGDDNRSPRLSFRTKWDDTRGTLTERMYIDDVGTVRIDGGQNVVHRYSAAFIVDGDVTGTSNRLVRFTAGNDGLRTDEDILFLSTTDQASAFGRFITCQAGADLKFVIQADGNVFADGSYTGPADFAEMLPVSSGASSVEAGDVMVIDPTDLHSITKSSQPRSSLVAGIYSTKPGFVGSERDWEKPEGSTTSTYSIAEMATEFNEIPMAVVGIVPCKVSAENGAIRPGDLLVTSSTPGHAMRDKDPKNGTIVGKALGELSGGTGVIKVLVTLQ